VQSLQRARADQDRNFTFRETFDVAAVKFVIKTDLVLNKRMGGLVYEQ
jgi:hypothetical protein